MDKARLREDFDKYLTGASSDPPLREQSPAPGQMTKAAEPDEDDLALKIESEIDSDPTFQAAITGCRWRLRTASNWRRRRFCAKRRDGS